MFRKLVSICLLVSCTTVYANPRCMGIFTPEGQALHMGRKSYGAQPETIALGQHTDPDLDLLTLTYRLFDKKFSTAIGRARFKHLLLNPLLCADEIRTRQQAVRVLIENPELRVSLKRELQLFENANPVNTVQTYEGRGGGSAISSGLLAITPYLALGLVSLFWANDPLFTPEQAQRAISGFLGAFVLISSIIVAKSKSHPEGEALHDLKRGLSHVSSIQKELAGSDVPLLAEIEQALQAVKDPKHPLSLTKLINRLDFVPGLRGSKIMQALWIYEAAISPAALSFRKYRQHLARVMTAISELDLFVTLAEFASENPQYTFPEILSDDHPTYLKIEKGYNPFVLANNNPAVPTNVELGTNLPAQLALLSGPNKNGKSTFLKMIGNLTLLAQMGAPVPAQSMTLTPMVLMTSLSVKDSLKEAESLFFAQAKRLAELMKTSKGRPHVLFLLDEILGGTNPEMHTALEMAFIQRISESPHAVAVLATHDYKLQQLEGLLPGVVNLKVENSPKTRFQILRGPGRDRNAFEVVEEAGVPLDIVDLARHYYGLMEINEAPLPPILKSPDKL